MSNIGRIIAQCEDIVLGRSVPADIHPSCAVSTFIEAVDPVVCRAPRTTDVHDDCTESSIVGSDLISCTFASPAFVLLSGSNTPRVGYAGDWNNDGISDIVVAGSSTLLSYIGRVFIVFGQNGPIDNIITLSDVAINQKGVRINAISGGDGLGNSISYASDWNNDGIPDIVIGAFNADSGNGEVYIVFGQNGSTGGTIELSTLVADQNGVIITTDTSIVGFQGLGKTVSYAGDWNKDGIDDIIIAGTSGGAYIVFGQDGSTGGTISLTTLVFDQNGAVIDVGTATLDKVSNAGDWNNDGTDDVVIGDTAGTGQVQIILEA